MRIDAANPVPSLPTEAPRIWWRFRRQTATPLTWFVLAPHPSGLCSKHKYAEDLDCNICYNERWNPKDAFR